MASDTLPEQCAIAFKEWAGVCSALAEGRQSLILRKGGIAEGPGGFAPEHATFWLYPTRVHEAEQGLKVTSPAPTPDGSAPAGATVELQALAMVDSVWFADRIEDLGPLDDLHVWTAETVEKRFHYRRPGLWVLGVRICRLPGPKVIAVTPEQAGCKTWVPLDPPLSTAGAEPVLAEAEFSARMNRLRSALGRGR